MKYKEEKKISFALRVAGLCLGITCLLQSGLWGAERTCIWVMPTGPCEEGPVTQPPAKGGWRRPVGVTPVTTSPLATSSKVDLVGQVREALHHFFSSFSWVRSLSDHFKDEEILSGELSLFSFDFMRAWYGALSHP